MKFLPLMLLLFAPSAVLQREPARAGAMSKTANLRAVTIDAIRLIREDRYDSAFVLIQRLNAEYPEAPQASLLAADAYQTLMRDYRVKLYEAPFDSAIQRTLALARAAVKRRPTGENYFILATAQGYKSIHAFYSGSLLRGIRAAVQSIGTMKKSARLDPELADPLFGLAIYEYGKYKAFGFGLALFKKKRQYALELLKRVRANGLYVQAHAAYSMQKIYYDGGEYKKALRINDALFARFSRNPSCLYHRALILDALNRHGAANTVWLRLLERIRAFETPSNGYLAECHYRLANNYWRLQQPEMTRQHLRLARRFARNFNRNSELESPYLSQKKLLARIKTLGKRSRDKKYGL